jgi:hypothetical protein
LTPEYILFSFIISVFSGGAGALLGLGGGVFLVPLLVYTLGVPMHLAAGASILAVIATSSAAAANYVDEELTNIRLGMFLELATTLGAVTGAFLAFASGDDLLQGIFGASLLYASASMFFQMKRTGLAWIPKRNDGIAERLRLSGGYHDKATGENVAYGVDKSPILLGVSYIAGIISGLLGIGGGAIKVPAMNILGGVPMKAAVATSNFMVGVTAAASAMVYIRYGHCDAFITGPVIFGTLIGASIAARYTNRINGSTIKILFIAVLAFIGVKMILTGVGIW